MLADIGFKSAELIWRVTATNSDDPVVAYAESDSRELRQTISELYGDGVAIRIAPRSQAQPIECRTIVDDDDIDQWECVGL